MGYLRGHFLKKANKIFKRTFSAKSSTENESFSYIQDSALEIETRSCNRHSTQKSCRQDRFNIPTEVSDTLNTETFKETVIQYLAQINLEEFQELMSQILQIRKEVYHHEENEAVDITSDIFQSNKACPMPSASRELSADLKSTERLLLKPFTQPTVHKEERESVQILGCSGNKREVDQSGKFPKSEISNECAINLLTSVFPVDTLPKLKWEMGNTVAKHYDSASVFFSDIVGFTNWCSTQSPSTVIECLSAYFQILDDSAERFGVYKVETIGDAWMGVCGAPSEVVYHADIMGHFALEVLETLQDLSTIFQSSSITMRIGLHCGPVVSGVVRADRPRWQLFGDTVNMASRMESTGLPGHIQISRDMYDELMRSTRTRFICKPRGQINLKGKGNQETFFLTDLENDLMQRDLMSKHPAKNDRLTIFNPDSPSQSMTRSHSVHLPPAVRRPLTISNPEDISMIRASSPSFIKEPRSSQPQYLEDLQKLHGNLKETELNYGDQCSILVVDDKSSILMQFRRVLKKTGMQVYVAQNGIEALELLKERKYVLVFMDIKMPEMDGIQCITQFRQWESEFRPNSKKQPVIAMSADKDVVCNQQDLITSLGFDEFHHKEANKSTILEKFAQFWSH